MNIHYKNIILSCTLAVGAVLSASAASSIRAYTYPGNRPDQAPAMQFMPDGQTYVTLSEDGTKLVMHDVRNGKETGILVDAATTRENQISTIDDFKLSPDASKVLLQTAPEKIYRHSVKASYYVYEVRSRILKPLSTVHKRQQAPLFSPDSRMVAFVDSNNIFIKKLDYGTEVAVTRDGKVNRVINGVPDWTYEEEFTTTCSMAWAPDNLTLSYLRYDETEVPTYTLPIYSSACHPIKEYELYPGVKSYKYPVAGQPNSRVTLRSYNVETRKDWSVPLPTKGAVEYIPRIAYGPTADALITVTLNRDQNIMEVFSINPRSTVGKSIIVEKNAGAWIEPNSYEQLAVLPSGIVMQSSRSGFNHLYEYSYTGELKRTITSGDWDVTAFYGYDPALDSYYFQSTKAGAANRVISRVDSKGRITDITAATGTAEGVFSDDMKYALVTYSSCEKAPEVAVCEAKSGKPLVTVVDNKSYVSQYAGLTSREFITVKGATGETLNAMIVKPAGLTPGKKYPVIVNQYSGPGSQAVLNKWDADWTLWFAQQGYAVVTIDPRGTGGRGRKFMDVVYRKLGEDAAADLVAAVGNLAATYPWMDKERVGIYGWSYGGYQALMCATEAGNPFKAAVAVAPVTDWRFYDTVYSERYMLTPGQNPEGYLSSSPLERLSNLQSRLLLMWGTADDNVHPANSLELLSRLENAGKWADVLVFPNSNHSINGCNLRATLYERMLRFYKDNL